MRPALEEHRGLLGTTRMRMREMQPGHMIEVVLPKGEPARRIIYQSISRDADRIFGRGNYALHTTLDRTVELTCRAIAPAALPPNHRFRPGVFGPFRGSVSST